VEEPYISRVLKEWGFYLQTFETAPRIKEIHLGGGTPTFFTPEHLTTLINGITSSAIICDDAEFSFEAHPNNTTQEHLQTLYNLGFRRLSLGIQDFNHSVQAIINRIQSFEAVEKVTNYAKQIGYSSINFDLIYGLPLQTKESIIDTIEKVNLLLPHRIAFYSYAHVPWIKPGQRKFTEADLPVDKAKRELYEIGREMLEQSGYVEIGMDHFALQTDSLYTALKTKQLHRNFMGYTSSHTMLLVGLGVSSISDSWTCFSQNVKKVEEYYALVDKGEFPLLRGHLLNTEDLILRKHILNIMCKLETSWQHSDAQCDALTTGLTQLKEMENDGLIVITPFSLKVTETGRPFIRNICMALDARLWREQRTVAIFSQTI